MPAADDGWTDLGLLDAAEAVRREVEETLARGTVSPSRLDRLGETLATHIRVYTATAPVHALSGLLSDFSDVRHIAAHRQPAMVQARLSEIMALLGTLVADALMRLGRLHDARAWYGTSRIAADDTTNLELRARVRAQEAMLPYYYGHPGEAVRLARESQDILGSRPRDAGALATAAEARARARLGDRTGARRAMTRTETLTAAADEPDSDEAFHFGARRFFFYASGTYSNLGDTTKATHAQDQALTLYGEETGPIDPALIHLDQAQLLLAEGDTESAGQLAEDTLLTLPAEQRTLIFGTRLAQIIALTPSGNRTHRKLVDLHHQLAIETGERPSATSR